MIGLSLIENEFDWLALRSDLRATQNRDVQQNFDMSERDENVGAKWGHILKLVMNSCTCSSVFWSTKRTLQAQHPY